MVDKLRKELNVQLEDEEDFMYNIEYKGVYLVNHIYESYKFFSDHVEWKTVLNTIKFDKKLRNNLYKFLGTIEEYIKVKLFSEYDVGNRDVVFNSQNDKSKCRKALSKKTSNKSSNLYFVFQMTFGFLIDITLEKNLVNKNFIDWLEKVRDLRNKVMHHSVLLLGSATNGKDVLVEVENLKKGIESMYQVLPYQFRDGFEKSINKLSDKYDIKELKLGVMENGIFK